MKHNEMYLSLLFLKVKYKTLNPQWKEKFDFRVFEGDDTLSIEVWDRDFPSADDYIGT